MNLDDLRCEIDKIDYEMALLFQKRMEIVKEIIAYKKMHNINVLDQERENKMKAKNGSYVDSEFILYYQKYLESIMNISKEYQKNNG